MTTPLPDQAVLGWPRLGIDEDGLKLSGFALHQKPRRRPKPKSSLTFSCLTGSLVRLPAAPRPSLAAATAVAFSYEGLPPGRDSHPTVGARSRAQLSVGALAEQTNWSDLSASTPNTKRAARILGWQPRRSGGSIPVVAHPKGRAGHSVGCQATHAQTLFRTLFELRLRLRCREVILAPAGKVSGETLDVAQQSKPKLHTCLLVIRPSNFWFPFFAPPRFLPSHNRKLKAHLQLCFTRCYL